MGNVAEVQQTEQPAVQPTEQQTQQTQQVQQPSDDLGANEFFDSKEQQGSNQQEQNNAESQQNPDPLDQVPLNGEYKFVDENGKEVPAEEAKSFQEPFQKANLTQRQANILREQYNSSIKNVVEEYNKQAQLKADQAWSDMAKSWKADVIADKEFGGANLEQSKVYVARALNTFGDDDLKSFVKEGFGFRPSLFKLLARTGKMLSDDRFIDGSNVHTESQFEHNKRRYPKSPELWGDPNA